MAGRRPLEILGIDESEERVYRTLLSTGWATAADLAGLASSPPREVRRLLDRIEAKGLATHTTDRPRRYTAVSPEVAIEALVSQRRADLEHARSSMHELVEQANSTRSKTGEQIAEIVPRSAMGGLITQLDQSAQSEIIAFQRAPLLFAGSHPVQAKALAKGARIRSIAEAEFLAVPGVLPAIQDDMRSGEEVRILPKLPAKMAIYDRRVGLIPLDLDNPRGPVLLLRRSALLDMLCAYFETLWERATPLVLTSAGGIAYGRPEGRAFDDSSDLVALLAAGLPDKAIAYELGISSATLSRRLADLMKALSARSRFQAGWIAAHSKKK